MVLSVVLGWNLTLTVLAIGLPTALYTMFGGVQAVTWTDVKQMVVIVAGVARRGGRARAGLPDEVGIGEALHVAGATGRLQSVRLLVRPQPDLHVLVGHDRRRCS